MKTGVLVISHGSRKETWVRQVDEALSEISLDVPVVGAFLEMVEGRTIADGIRTLEDEGVDDIIVCPLFVCSGSTHIDEIQYMLGAVTEPSVETDVVPIPHRSRVRFTPAMNDDPLVLEIAKERLRELSVSPEREVLLVAGHGSVVSGFHERWEETLRQYSARLQQDMGFKKGIHGTFRPETLRSQAQTVAEGERLVVFPMFLSEGYFTEKKVPEQLEGIPAVYNGKTYLPHPLVGQWMEKKVRAQLQKG